MKAKRIVSAGIVVVRETLDGQGLFLLLRAYRNWDFPKGEIERGEDTLAAALRETAEETGIEDIEFPWGEDYIDVGPYGKHKIARYYLGHTQIEQVELAVNPELGRPEHHEHRWADLIEAVQLALKRLQPVIAWAARKVAGG